MIVVERDADGTLEVQKATDHSTPSRSEGGPVGVVALRIIFTPTVLGGAAVLRTVGAATGKAREMHHRSGLPEELASAIAPGHSGIVALVSDPGAVEIRKALESADAIVVSGSTTYWPATSRSQPRRPRPRRTPREPEDQPVRITCAG